MATGNVSQPTSPFVPKPQCIDCHPLPLQAQPPYRLPALYVLDSISKNIGAPYTTLWSQRIAHLYLDTYRVVDQQTKMRMEELLTTWRTGGQGGNPLFGGDAQWAIERNIYGSSGVPGGPAPMRPPPAMRLNTPTVPTPRATLSPVPPNRSTEATRAIEQIDRLLALMSADQQRNLPSFNPQRMAALKQLRNVVATASLSPQEMSQIQTQLNALAVEFKRDRGGSSTPTLPSASLAPPPQAAPTPSFGAPGGDRSTPVGGAPPIPANLSAALASLTRQGLIGGQQQGVTNSPVPTTASPAPAAAAPSDDLVKSLIAAGLLPASSTASANGKPARQDDAYTAAIMSLDIKLTSMDLQKELTLDLVDLVGHKHLPLQCRQCANRYPAGQAGQKSLDAHLDWHFRQGRRAKDSAARGLSRSWLDTASEWLRGGQDDPSTSLSSTGAADGKKGLSAQQEAELKEATDMWIVAPTDSEKTNEPCPICKEKFVSEWSEDEEEWIWKNARKVDEEIYHGSCYYSARVLSSNVANRGTTGTPGARASTERRRSRTATPDADLARSAAPSANPLSRVKGDEAAMGGHGGNKKRKEGPLAGDAAAGEGGEPEGKRVAIEG